jgi:hypothetical protein
MTSQIVRLQVRHATAAEWNASNPVLAVGEIGYESDTNTHKIGDGLSEWVDLPYEGTAPGGTVNNSLALGGTAAANYILASQIGATGAGTLSGSNFIYDRGPLTGQVPLKQYAINQERTSLMRFGAVGNGVTDDAPALRAAVAALQGTGKTLYVPAGVYRLNSVVSGAVVTITKDFKMFCDKGAYFVYDTGVSTSNDIFLIEPPTILDGSGNATIYSVEGVWFEGMWCYEMAYGGAMGRDVIRVHLTTNNGLRGLTVDQCFLRASSGGTGRGINVVNDPTSLNNNGLFCSVIERSQISGFKFQNLGDSVSVKDNQFGGGPGVIGIEGTMLPYTAPSGASSMFLIKNNNITSQGGAIKITKGRNVHIKNNNMEQLVDLTGGHLVILENLDYDIQGKSVVEGNKIEPMDPTSQCGAILLNNCTGTSIRDNYLYASAVSGSGSVALTITNGKSIKVEDNRIYISAACTGINIDSNSKNCEIFGNEYDHYNTLFTDVVDNGQGTKGVMKALTYASANWFRYSDGTTKLTYLKDRSGIVHLQGCVARTGGSASQGDNITILPVGARPLTGGSDDTYMGGTLRFIAAYVTAATGAATLPIGVRILDSASGYDGVVAVADATASITNLSLDGITFFSPDVP